MILDVIPTEGTRESIYAFKILEKTLTDSFTKIKVQERLPRNGWPFFLLILQRENSKVLYRHCFAFYANPYG